MPNFALGKGHGGVQVVLLPRDNLPKVHGKWRCPQPTAIGSPWALSTYFLEDLIT